MKKLLQVMSNVELIALAREMGSHPDEKSPISDKIFDQSKGRFKWLELKSALVEVLADRLQTADDELHPDE